MTAPKPGAGVALALVAAASFGISGPLLKPLLEVGWSPTALVIVRSLISALTLLVPGALALRGRRASLWAARNQIVTVGLVGVAASQLAFAQSLKTLPVGTAILIQYSAPVLIVLVQWFRSSATPSIATMSASCLTICGLLAVAWPHIDSRFDLGGVLWALAAMITVALYYVAASQILPEAPVITAVLFSQIIGAVALLLIGQVGLTDISFATSEPVMGGHHVPWWVPITAVGVIATALGFWSSIVASRILGSQVASFFGTLEVVVAFIAAWLILAEKPSLAEVVGGSSITIGVAIMRTRLTRTN